MTTHLQTSESGRPQFICQVPLREVSSSWASAPTILAPPFELCESCDGREGKLIDTRYGRGGFLVCPPCYGPMTLLDWMTA